MTFLNIEIKARCADPGPVRNYLRAGGAQFKGIDQQTDTYFHTRNGRLKLREGNIESNLIYYERADEAGPRPSNYVLLKVDNPPALKKVLTETNGIRVVVKKKREIYYIDNVKFHIDEVEGLGSFVEIEAGNRMADLPAARLREQCDQYLAAFKIRPEDLIHVSYSDLLESPFIGR